MNGLYLFGKYSFAPNILQYCGPRDSDGLVQILNDFALKKEKTLNKELKNLLLHFEGAVPYLKLIAESNNIKDIFDARAVEAYWLGNNLLNRVGANSLYKHIDERFRKRMGFKSWQAIKNSPLMPESKPFHNFHVLNIYSQTGLLRSGARDSILNTINKCMINYGTVKETNLKKESRNSAPENVLVEYNEIAFDRHGALTFANKKTDRFSVLNNSIKKDDTVSTHWDFICDKITPLQKKNLKYWTEYHLKIANNVLMN